MSRVINIDGEEYEEIPAVSVKASEIIVEMWEELGRPSNPFTDSGEKLLDIMIAVWEDLYPKDSREWFAARKEYQDHEMSIGEQVKKRTGRSLASFPMPLYKMMKQVFTDVKLTERETCMKLIKRWPMFRMANKV